MAGVPERDRFAEILDSDVLIWWLRGREDVVEKIKAFLRDGEKLYITPVNVAEIWAGLRKNEERKVKMIFEVIEVLNIDFSAKRSLRERLVVWRGIISTSIEKAMGLSLRMR